MLAGGCIYTQLKHDWMRLYVKRSVVIIQMLPLHHTYIFSQTEMIEKDYQFITND